MKTSVQLFLLFGLASVLQATVLIDKLPYEYVLSEVGRRFEGEMFATAPEGSRVPAKEYISILEHNGEAAHPVAKDLQITVQHNGHMILPIVQTDHEPNGSNHHVLADKEFAIIQTEYFDVDENFFLVSKDTEDIEKVPAVILFYVALVTTLNGTIVSNTLPFVVYVISSPDTSVGNGPGAIFAGIITLIICFFAVFIPFGIRTKRRMKAGKPIFGCGSYPSDDKEKLAKEKRGIDNPTVVTEDYDSPQRTSQTIQDRMLRTVSDIDFQPKWLDPHFKDDHHVRAQAPMDDVIQTAGQSSVPRQNEQAPLNVKL